MRVARPRVGDKSLGRGRCLWSEGGEGRGGGVLTGEVELAEGAGRGEGIAQAAAKLGAD
jgi:hypothetical protein